MNAKDVIVKCHSSEQLNIILRHAEYQGYDTSGYNYLCKGDKMLEAFRFASEHNTLEHCRIDWYVEKGYTNFWEFDDWQMYYVDGKKNDYTVQELINLDGRLVMFEHKYCPMPILGKLYVVKTLDGGGYISILTDDFNCVEGNGKYRLDFKYSWCITTYKPEELNNIKNGNYEWIKIIDTDYLGEPEVLSKFNVGDKVVVVDPGQSYRDSEGMAKSLKAHQFEKGSFAGKGYLARVTGVMNHPSQENCIVYAINDRYIIEERGIELQCDTRYICVNNSLLEKYLTLNGVYNILDHNTNTQAFKLVDDAGELSWYTSSRFKKVPYGSITIDASKVFVGMHVRCINNDYASLKEGKLYQIIKIYDDWFTIVNEQGIEEDYLQSRFDLESAQFVNVNSHSIMQVVCINADILKSDKLTLNKIYDVINHKKGFYRIIDDNGKSTEFDVNRFETLRADIEADVIELIDEDFTATVAPKGTMFMVGCIDTEAGFDLVHLTEGKDYSCVGFQEPTNSDEVWGDYIYVINDFGVVSAYHISSFNIPEGIFYEKLKEIYDQGFMSGDDKKRYEDIHINLSVTILDPNFKNTMYITDIIKNRMNAKFYTDKKLDEITSICEDIKTRVEQSKATRSALYKEESTLESIFRDINNSTGDKDINGTEAALAKYTKFLEYEKIAFEEAE